MRINIQKMNKMQFFILKMIRFQPLLKLSSCRYNKRDSHKKLCFKFFFLLYIDYVFVGDIIKVLWYFLKFKDLLFFFVCEISKNFNSFLFKLIIFKALKYN